ncbi:chemotaxis protein CheD [Bacillus sp. FJAT-49732]|uniref:Probable chemoreceptor glutamine deamidase CheD n=1 Tax=Lederbergia citrisecunda TaxID=2833583 RepID=A0A942YK88_9BACI|nr:chemotaxis protein CheD [Lederbergia citrisecunda]MBS4198979.1 chemotaxis protein CheD [Lederbergia citrisecunda]
MIDTVVRVGIADMKIVKSPDKIRTSGLGSCVGVVVYDKQTNLAGLAHIMLPDSSLSRGEKAINKAKFADTAIKELKRELISQGASNLRLKAKIAGGAQMFHFSSQNDQMRVGPRNIEAVKKELKSLNIQLVAEDTGGHSGRTIEFDTETCMLQIKTVYQDIIEI